LAASIAALAGSRPSTEEPGSVDALVRDRTAVATATGVRPAPLERAMPWTFSAW
jgi:hypothetical protein